MAYDLDFSPSGRIIVGKETAEACNHAHKMSELLPESQIIVSAGRATGDKWNGVIMSEVMASFLSHQGVTSDRIISLVAKKFNTQGEAKAVAEYLKQNREIKTIVIIVKWWHATRTWSWLDLYLKKMGIFDVTIRMETCHSWVSPEVIRKEFWLANPYNLIRMWLYRLFG